MWGKLKGGEMLNIKVSVIVPVYNNEEYLRRCFDSFVNQTLKEIEIILLNDCSTDGSLAIMKEYEEMYPEKVIVIDMKQKGWAGGARNIGISIAKGEYLGFVDSDDYVETDMYEEMYKTAKSKDYDMVDSGFYNQYTHKFKITTTKNTWGELNIEKRKFLIARPGYLWSKIIKRSIFIDNNLRFRENIAYEDVDFMSVLMLYLKSVCGSDDVFYFYQFNEKSITNTKTYEIQIDARMKSMISLVKKFKELNEYETYRDEITFIIYYTYIDMLKHYTLGLEEKEVNYEMYQKLQEFFFELVDYDYSDNKYIIRMDKKERMYAELNNADYKVILDTCYK